MQVLSSFRLLNIWCVWKVNDTKRERVMNVVDQSIKWSELHKQNREISSCDDWRKKDHDQHWIVSVFLCNWILRCAHIYIYMWWIERIGHQCRMHAQQPFFSFPSFVIQRRTSFFSPYSRKREKKSPTRRVHKQCCRRSSIALFHSLIIVWRA